MKALSSCGHCCFCINGLILIIVASMTFGTTFWAISFTDCPNFTDEYFYITLDNGYCTDENGDVTSGWDDCTSWSDLEDSSLDDDVSEGASDYIDANGLSKAALAFCVVNFVFIIINMSSQQDGFRIVQFLISMLSVLMFVCVLGVASDTYYTDLDNYFLDSVCDKSSSIASIGWFSAALGVILSIIGNCCNICPLCGCADDSTGTSQSLVITTTTTTFTPSASSRIVVATATMSKFLRAMMGAKDRCSVVAFNTDYKPMLLLGTEDEAIANLNRCRSMCDGATHLWDSICLSVAQFVLTADGTRPWVLIILTDGDDVGSSSSLDEAATMLAKFNVHSTNFVFVIGLGSDVNTGALNKLCNQSRSFYMHANDAAALELLFPLIALQVT